jgi:hypothetical protein
VTRPDGAAPGLGSEASACASAVRSAWQLPQPRAVRRGRRLLRPPAVWRPRRARRLRRGSRVAVVATSGRGEPGVLAKGCQLLASWGLDVQLGPHALDGHAAFGYLAGTDAARAADLQQAWLDPRVEAVLRARGGYGAQRIPHPALIP